MLLRTIKTYLSGLRSALIDFGIEDLSIFHHPSIHRLLITCVRRRQGEADKRERLPITRDILLQLLFQLDITLESHATLHAAHCLAFAAFLRIGEFTYSDKDPSDRDFAAWHVTRQSIEFQKDRLFLFLPASKTDCFRKGVNGDDKGFKR